MKSSALPENISKADAILVTLANIPFGKVSTYGDVAKRAGLQGLARYVAKVLKDLPPDSSIPWHRVVNSQGKSSFPKDSDMYNLQLSTLQKEGIQLSPSSVINKQFFW